MRLLNLKTLILGIVLFTFSLTLTINLWSAHRINTQTLTDSTLEVNRVYAQKLAATTDLYIEETFHTLAYSAKLIGPQFNNVDLLANEVERLRETNGMFNSVIVANKNSQVLGVSPPSLNLKGTVLNTPGPQQAIVERKPLISNPYIGVTNRLIIFISYPIFNDQDEYLGFIGGSIYIKEDNFFSSILGQHYSDDGSYVYVVDQEGRIIYHKDANRINDIITDNKVVQKVMEGESGASLVTNTQNIDMLAGYSPVNGAGWGVISQRPLEQALAPSKELQASLWKNALPFLLLTLLIAIWMAIKISKPLHQLAQLTALKTDEHVLKELEKVPSWYFETSKLKYTLAKTLKSLLHQVSFFKAQSSTDALTGLLNRRTFDDLLENLSQNSIPFTIAILDLDFFKKVNDEFGHSVGDLTLQYFAEVMLKHTPDEAYCCRYGGEEFTIIFPNLTNYEAYQYVEKIRRELEITDSPCGRPVTASVGLANMPHNTTSLNNLLVLADEALYLAKANGRNKVMSTKSVNKS